MGSGRNSQLFSARWKIKNLKKIMLKVRMEFLIFIHIVILHKKWEKLNLLKQAFMCL